MLRHSAALFAIVTSLTILLSACVPGSDEAGAAEPSESAAAPADPDREGVGAVEPAGPPPLAGELNLPPGMAGVRWAEGLVQPVAITFDASGRLLVAELGGRVWALQDQDGDGLADQPEVFAEGLGELRGIAIGPGGRVYLIERGRVSLALDDDGDGVADSVSPILRSLPSGLHASNAVAVGPDGRLYIAIGSTCNDCVERNPLSASVLVFDPATGEIRVFAAGLRNPYDLVFAPDGVLWATDQGSQQPCASPDELNIITQGAHYGWPYCAGETSFFVESGLPVVQLGMENGAAGIVWFESPLFAEEFRRGLFIALATEPGTLPASPTELHGPSVQFLRIYEDGSLKLREFASGFRRPVDIAAGPDNGVYVADADAGVIYRIGAPFED